VPQVLVYVTAPNVPAGCEPETEMLVILDEIRGPASPAMAAFAPPLNAIRAAHVKKLVFSRGECIGISSKFLAARYEYSIGASLYHKSRNPQLSREKCGEVVNPSKPAKGQFALAPEPR
jgi:hypothetical protein